MRSERTPKLREYEIVLLIEKEMYYRDIAPLSNLYCLKMKEVIVGKVG